MINDVRSDPAIAAETAREEATPNRLRVAVERVVASDNCSGCGLCAALTDDLQMRLNEDGNLRPVWVGGDLPDSKQQLRRFKSACPGVAIQAARIPGARRHSTLGPYISAWKACAADPAVRHAGSSGGVLTALSTWLIESGRASSVVGAGASTTAPTRTVPLVLRTKAEVLASAGSRYAPVGVASLLDEDLLQSGAAFVGKPCEAFAVRRAAEDLADGRPRPFILSFFCAGVPSQTATDSLVDRLASGKAVSSVRYRGNGWPGRFTVTAVDGTSAQMSYDESWGKNLGPHVQDRCKICPDGVGEHADIAVGDFWNADERGYPIFRETDGMSVAIARTRRGHEALLAARDEGLIELEQVDIDEVAGVQPLQVARRRMILARLIGYRLAGRPVPSVRGYRPLRTAITTAKSPLSFIKEFIAVVRGSRARARSRAGSRHGGIRRD